MKRKWEVFLMVMLLMMALNANATVLFSDNYNRANDNNIDASSGGMGGSLGSLTYVEIGDDEIYPVQSGTGNPYPELTHIENNQLYMATGTNMSTMYLDHNFTDAAILSDGGMKIGLSIIQDLGAGTTGQYFAGFGVGNTLQECEDVWFDHNGTGFRGQVGNSLQEGVSDLWVGWSPRFGGIIQVFKNGPTEKGGENYNIENISLTGNDRLELELFFDSFGDGSTVNANILWNGTVVGTDSFAWDADTMLENYIGINGRQAAGFVVDDLVIQTIPEPATLLLLGVGALVLRKRK